MKVLKGTENYYRIRIRDYRIGIYWEEGSEEVHIVRIIHRKDFYRFFLKG